MVTFWGKVTTFWGNIITFGGPLSLQVDLCKLCQIHQTKFGRGPTPLPFFGYAKILRAPIMPIPPKGKLQTSWFRGTCQRKQSSTFQMTTLAWNFEFVKDIPSQGSQVQLLLPPDPPDFILVYVPGGGWGLFGSKREGVLEVDTILTPDTIQTGPLL